VTHDYHYGGDACEYPTTEVMAGGKKLVFRALAAHEVQAAILASQRAGDGDAAAMERTLQLLARSIVSIDGFTLPRVDPGAMFSDNTDREAEAMAVLRRRIQTLYGYPNVLLMLLSDAWIQAQQHFTAMLKERSTPSGRWN